MATVAVVIVAVDSMGAGQLLLTLAVAALAAAALLFPGR